MNSLPPFTIEALADRLHAEVDGCSTLEIHGLNTIEEAQSGELTFIGTERHARLWAASSASGAVVDREVEVPGHDATQRALLFVENADLAMAELLGLFLGEEERPAAGISEQASVSPSATVDPSATVMDWSSVGEYTTIGARVLIERGVHIGPHCTIGDDCHLRAGAVIRERCTLGARVNIHSNAVIGADGFGYRPDPDGRLIKIPHVGAVLIEDDVEIGAGTTIDRGKFGATQIGAQTKIDNLCQIGHSVKIGRGCVLSGQVGIAGSSVIGDQVQMAGQVGVKDHVNIASGTRVAAKSGVMRDTTEGATIGGSPAIDLREYMRLYNAWSKMPDFQRAVRKIEQQLKERGESKSQND